MVVHFTRKLSSLLSFWDFAFHHMIYQAYISECSIGTFTEYALVKVASGHLPSIHKRSLSGVANVCIEVNVSSVAVSLSRPCQHLSLPLLGSAIFPHRTISITIYSRNIQNTQVIQNTLESDSKAKMDLSFHISAHVFESSFSVFSTIIIHHYTHPILRSKVAIHVSIYIHHQMPYSQSCCSGTEEAREGGGEGV